MIFMIFLKEGSISKIQTTHFWVGSNSVHSTWHKRKTRPVITWKCLLTQTYSFVLPFFMWFPVNLNVLQNWRYRIKYMIYVVSLCLYVEWYDWSLNASCIVYILSFTRISYVMLLESSQNSICLRKIHLFSQLSFHC